MSKVVFVQDLINQGEAALIALYKYVSCHGSTKLANASIQVAHRLSDCDSLQVDRH